MLADTDEEFLGDVNDLPLDVDVNDHPLDVNNLPLDVNDHPLDVDVNDHPLDVDVNNLPLDVLICIFDWLDTRTLSNCVPLVSRSWLTARNHPTIKKKIALSRWLICAKLPTRGDIVFFFDSMALFRSLRHLFRQEVAHGRSLPSFLAASSIHGSGSSSLC